MKHWQMKWTAKIFAGAMAALLCLPQTTRAQQWYYHSVHSSSLALQYGRTYKLSYAYQLSRARQLKISGMYVFDEFDNGPDHVKSDVYNVNLQFQYNLLHFDKAFVGMHVGGGGYILKAGNLVDQRFKERKLNATFGLQGEYFINKSSMALVADYDVLYFPFSDLYEFLHLPRVGVKFVF